jgi:hypothetical protein
MTEIKEAEMPSNDYWTQIMGATPTNNPTTSPSLPTAPVADVRREQQTLGSGTNGPVNSYGNDMGLANQMNTQAEKMKALNATPSLPSPGGANSAPSAPTYNPFAMPGDRYGDDKIRQANYESMLKQAGSERGLGGSKRAAAKIQAAQGMLAPGLAQMEAQGKDYAQQMSAYNAGSLPSSIGGATGGLNEDVMKGLFSMFGTNQKPGATPAPGATASPATTPAVPSATTTPAAAPNQASAMTGYKPYWQQTNDVTSFV